MCVCVISGVVLCCHTKCGMLTGASHPSQVHSLPTHYVDGSSDARDAKLAGGRVVDCPVAGFQLYLMMY